MAQSHTATNEWQSFELRMRRRRLQRCVARAHLALEAGLLDQAQAAIDEALSLDPQDHAARNAAERIAVAAADLPLRVAPVLPDSTVIAESSLRAESAQPDPEEDAPRPRSRWPARAAAVLLIMLAGASGWYWARTTRWQPVTRSASTGIDASTNSRGPTRPVRSTAAAPDLGPVDPSAPPVTDSPAATPADSVTIATEVATVVPTIGDSPRPVEREPGPATERAVVPQPLASASSTAASPAADAAPPSSAGNTRPAPALNEIPVSPAPALAEAPAAPPPVPVPPAAEQSTASALASGSPISAATPLPAPAAPPAEAPELAGERAVRATLSRYESAYSQLDAAAAGAVWPAVDRRALARAFDGLASQTVRLGRCDVRVNGSTARADCAGSARWTPKVGGGAQSSARRWRFELRQAGSDWQIVSADAR